MKCLKEKCSRKEKTNCGNQVAEIQGKWGERKKDCGNQVAKNEREKNFVVAEIVEDLIEILAIKLLQSCLSLMLQ